VEFLLIIPVIGVVVIVWVALIQRGQRQATADELSGWSPRSKRRRRRRRSEREADED
jgi:hypothetical protein